MATVGERIREARTSLNMTQQELADAVGVARNAVHKWETNRTTPRDRFIQKLSEILKLEKDAFNRWGDASAPRKHPLVCVHYVTLQDVAEHLSVDNALRKPPGEPMMVPQPTTPELYGAEVIEHELRHVVEDDSMAQDFKQGEIVHLHSIMPPVDGDVVLAWRKGDDEGMLRYYRHRGKDRFELWAANPDYPTVSQTGSDEVLVLATAFRHLRELRRVAVTPDIKMERETALQIVRNER